MADRSREQMTPDEMARGVEAGTYNIAHVAAALRRLAALERDRDQPEPVKPINAADYPLSADPDAPLRKMLALEAENKRLRARLERAEVVLRALCDDHVRIEMRAHGKSVGDTIAGLAREALEGGQ